MKGKRMGKLVRDNIPLVIARDTGAAPKTRRLEGPELVAALLDKIIEEVGELRAARGRKNIQEEMGDVSEVVDALRDALYINARELEMIKERKRAAKGGFSCGIFLCD